ncbi:hypothetical protein GCM10022218_04260 [Sphingobacterium ginsenosidimutans]|uniref:Uncharacterized protein n=1 Tax=Sphingobacterium ginsenosidimutans TaxID=687845 RepID=A0ABP7ZRK6_9SPHI
MSWINSGRDDPGSFAFAIVLIFMEAKSTVNPAGIGILLLSIGSGSTGVMRDGMSFLHPISNNKPNKK